MKTFKYFIIPVLVGLSLITAAPILTKETRVAEFYSYTCTGLIFTNCTVNLSSNIGDPTKYEGLRQMIHERKITDTVVWELAGYGGFVTGEEELAHMIKASPALHIARVYGDVYSAHAYLAISMDRLEVARPEALMMFHRSSLYGNELLLCAPKAGELDRKQDAYRKCIELTSVLEANENKFIRRLFKDLLSERLINDVIAGKDVYVSAVEIQKRYKANANR